MKCYRNKTGKMGKKKEAIKAQPNHLHTTFQLEHICSPPAIGPAHVPCPPLAPLVPYPPLAPLVYTVRRPHSRTCPSDVPAHPPSSKRQSGATRPGTTELPNKSRSSVQQQLCEKLRRSGHLQKKPLTPAELRAARDQSSVHSKTIIKIYNTKSGKDKLTILFEQLQQNIEHHNRFLEAQLNTSKFLNKLFDLPVEEDEEKKHDYLSTLGQADDLLDTFKDINLEILTTKLKRMKMKKKLLNPRTKTQEKMNLQMN
uniref:Uncharacterized protein n=1 Tax=Globodera rostochiensis TaxID=31243 RepID=A0A914HLC0_GLORO